MSPSPSSTRAADGCYFYLMVEDSGVTSDLRGWRLFRKDIGREEVMKGGRKEGKG